MSLNYESVIAEIAATHIPPEDAFTLEQFVDDANQKIRELNPDREDIPLFTVDNARAKIKWLIKEGVVEDLGRFSLGATGQPPIHYRFK